MTRDRIAYDAVWGGRRFTLVDTGGWEPDARGLQAMVSAQAERAVATADVVLFVVDGRTGATETDLVVARTLRRSGRPVVLAATKIDDDRARVRRRRAVVARARRAACGERAARPGERRPARRRAGRAARRAGGRGRRGRPAPGRADRPPERRQVQPAQPAHPRGARRRRLGRRHDDRPGRQPGRARRRDLALRRHGGTAPPGQPGERDGVLREPAHRGRDRGCRGRRRPARRVRDDQRAGPARRRRRRRGRPGARPRAQQVGPARRGPPAATGTRDRPRLRPRRVGAARSTSRRRPAAPSRNSPATCAPASRRGTSASRPAG